MFETIVWATDGSELADGALEHVVELARAHRSKIVAVHANELFVGRYGGAPVSADEPEMREKIAQQVEELQAAGFDAELEIRSGSPDVATLIARAADDVTPTSSSSGRTATAVSPPHSWEAWRVPCATPRTSRCSSFRRTGGSQRDKGSRAATVRPRW